MNMKADGELTYRAASGPVKGEPIMFHFEEAHSPADRSCAVPAPRWRCRCSTRWCRRRPLLAQTAASAEAAVRRPASCRTARRPATGFPSTEGPLAAELPFNWKPLEPFREQTVILSGLHSRSAEPPPGVTGADHWVAAAFLCADKPKKTAGADVCAGTTIDQIIAQKIGERHLLPSLQMAVEDPGRQLEQLRRGLQLRLHQHDLVGDRRPRRCRWS